MEVTVPFRLFWPHFPALSSPLRQATRRRTLQTQTDLRAKRGKRGGESIIRDDGKEGESPQEGQTEITQKKKGRGPSIDRTYIQ